MHKASLILSGLVLPLLASCAVVQYNGVPPAHAPAKNNISFENLNETTPSVARSWDKTEIEKQIAGKTFLRNYPGKQNEVLYFSPDNLVYQWVSGNQSVVSSTWVVDLLSPRIGVTAKLFICTTLSNPATANPGVNQVRRCIDPSMLFIPATEHADGDVFGIAGKTVAPGSLVIERTTITDVKKRFSK